MLIGKWLNGLAKRFNGVKFQKLWIKCYKMSLIGMNIGAGGDVETSGERFVIKYIKELGKKGDRQSIIFDVGANVGNYTRELLELWGEGEVHCFEPSKTTFATLSDRMTAKNVILNNFGIGEECAEKTLYSNEENSVIASLYQRQLDYLGVDFEQSETVLIDTLDNYCKQNKIPYIDFLKIDIEGNELNALYGAKEMLNKEGIGVIQIEFGGCNIDSKTYFRDFWNLLHEDFIVYRILKDGLYKIEKYEETLEIFTCTNYLFVNRKGSSDDLV